MPPKYEPGQAGSRYGALKGDREEPLTRARRNAKLTLPWLIPEEGVDSSTTFYDPVVNVGTLGVNKLAAKITTAVFPPNEPFFSHQADEMAMEEAAGGDEEEINKARESLARYDRAVMNRIEAAGDRPKVELAAKHLLVAGNVLLDMTGSQMRVIPMTHYALRRDARGTVIELVIEELIHPMALPEGVTIPKKAGGGASSGDDEMLKLHTHIQLADGKYHGHQEVEGQLVPDTEWEKNPDDMAFLALRMVAVDGTSWGRSFVEGCAGDLTTLENLAQAVTDAAAASAKVVFLVRPNGMTRVVDLANAPNLGILTGDAADVTTLQVAKSTDLRVAAESAEKIEQRLIDQFLIRSTRDAERVTAEEIRYIALELDEALSGLYSLLSQEFQRPYVTLKIKGMKDLPVLPKDVVNLSITTGLEALRRGHELQKLQSWAETMTATFGPQEVAQMIPRDSFGRRLADALGLDSKGLIKSAEAATTDQANTAVLNAAEAAAPQLVKGAMNGP